MNLDQMLSQWRTFCAKYAFSDPDPFFKDIQEHYDKSPRFYHTFEGHIGTGLDDLARFQHYCENPELVYYSWLFHDAIQDPHRKDNEEQSAVYASGLAKRMRLPRLFSQDSPQLILATRHGPIPSSNDSRMMICLDLLIFAKPWEEYDQYRQHIAEEYRDIIATLSPKKFDTRRAGIIKRFAQRRALYPIYEIEREYGDKARENLRRELQELDISEL
ncbi:MAG: hypothetical protein ABIJ21_08905 [Nanoarchaeota archaeon]